MARSYGLEDVKPLLAWYLERVKRSPFKRSKVQPSTGRGASEISSKIGLAPLTRGALAEVRNQPLELIQRLPTAQPELKPLRDHAERHCGSARPPAMKR